MLFVALEQIGLCHYLHSMETPKTLQQAIVHFENPENCNEFMIAMRWPDGQVVCPTCGAEKVTYLYPQDVEEQKLVLIDPRISFGKPILVGVGIPTAVIADRFGAGEKIASLARDYGCASSEIKKAIDYEQALPKAA